MTRSVTGSARIHRREPRQWKQEIVTVEPSQSTVPGLDEGPLGDASARPETRGENQTNTWQWWEVMAVEMLLIVLLVLVLLGGGGWGYSRWRR